MKILKKIAICLLATILVILPKSKLPKIIMIIGTTIFSFTIKNIFSQNIVSTAVTSGILESFNDEVLKDNTKLNDKVNSLIYDDNTQELINKYIDTTLNSLVDEEVLETLNIEKDIIDYIKTNETKIEETFDVEITDEVYNKLTNEFVTTIKKSKEKLPASGTKIIKGFSFFVSLKFKLILFSMMAIILLLIALLQKSVHKWIKTLSTSSIISGLILGTTSIVLQRFLTSIVQTETSININIKTFTIASLIVLVARILV